MEEDWKGLVERAAAGDAGAARRLVVSLQPVVLNRVSRVAGRSRGSGGARGEQVEDLAQEVFAFLFGDGARALRAWDGGRGLSFLNFVGLLAERRAISIVRQVGGGGIRTLEDPLDEELLDRQPEPGPGPEPSALSREVLALLLDRLRLAVSPLGMHLFELLYVEERAVEEVVATCQMSSDAVYAWRSRLRKLVTRLAAEILDDKQPARPRVPGEDQAHD